MNLDQTTADRWAERLFRLYPSVEQWEKAKHSTLGGELLRDFAHAPGRMPMTTDWWVALQVEDAIEDRIAVDDNGGEWDALRTIGRALKPKDALEWLDAPTA